MGRSGDDRGGMNDEKSRNEERKSISSVSRCNRKLVDQYCVASTVEFTKTRRRRVHIKQSRNQAP